MQTNPLTSATQTPAAKSKADAFSNGMDKNAFLKLLAAQLQHQDPMNPANDQEFMGQMAQFSTLEQITNMASAQESQNKSSGMTEAVALIGHTVTYADAEGVQHTGVVKSVQTSDSGPTLTVDDTTGISPSELMEVS